MSIILLAYTFSDGLVRRFYGGFRRKMLRCHALARGASLGTMGNELW